MILVLVFFLGGGSLGGFIRMVRELELGYQKKDHILSWDWGGN